MSIGYLKTTQRTK